MANLSAVENEILVTIQRNSSLKQKPSLSELAEECHVSQSTVVKLAKKMGYTGYVDMAYKMYSEREWEESFRADLIEGDLEWTVRKLALKLLEFEDCKNIIAKSPYRDLLGSYFSRKLQMLDIFAVDTYDYSMIMSPRQKRGFAMFCNESAIGDSTELMKIAQKEGYYTIVFSEDPANQLLRFSDFHVVFKKNNYKTANFYNARLLIFLEMVLSEYTVIRNSREEKDNEKTETDKK